MNNTHANNTSPAFVAAVAFVSGSAAFGLMAMLAGVILA